MWPSGCFARKAERTDGESGGTAATETRTRFPGFGPGLLQRACRITPATVRADPLASLDGTLQLENGPTPMKQGHGAG